MDCSQLTQPLNSKLTFTRLDGLEYLKRTVHVSKKILKLLYLPAIFQHGAPRNAWNIKMWQRNSVYITCRKWTGYWKHNREGNGIRASLIFPYWCTDKLIWTDPKCMSGMCAVIIMEFGRVERMMQGGCLLPKDEDGVENEGASFYSRWAQASLRISCLFSYSFYSSLFFRLTAGRHTPAPTLTNKHTWPNIISQSHFAAA